MARPIRVLVVDDSALSRRLIQEGLRQDPRLEVIGAAGDPYEARDLIVQLRPDVVTLDIDMPRMDGVSFLRRLMPRFPPPVVMASADNGPRLAEALTAGAVEVVFKPGVHGATTEGMLAELRTKVKIASAADVSHWKEAAAPTRPLGGLHSVLALGASTGGTDALEVVLRELPPGCPGVLVVQHMPRSFTGPFARRLNESCSMVVREAEDGESLQRGVVLVAPGDQHLELIQGRNGYAVRLTDGPPEAGHRPSVDVMMGSVAHTAGHNAIGVLLTGMGRDGARGMLAIRQAGGRTLAQDEATSVVYGMPRAAWENGGAEQRLPLPQIAGTVLGLLEAQSQPSRRTG